MYKCDSGKCPPFEQPKKVLVEKDSGFKQVTQVLTFKYFGADGKIYGGANPPKKGDFEIACPHCGLVHSFGMDSI